MDTHVYLRWQDQVHPSLVCKVPMPVISEMMVSENPCETYDAPAWELCDLLISASTHWTSESERIPKNWIIV